MVQNEVNRKDSVAPLGQTPKVESCCYRALAPLGPQVNGC